MPLLPKETEIFPEGIFSLPDAPSWRVAHVRSRQEKALSRYLLQRSVPFYLPQIERSKLRSGRRFTSWLPLFPGYVFFRGASDIVRRSDVVATLIDVPDQQRLAAELLQIRQLLPAGAFLIRILSVNGAVVASLTPARGDATSTS
jgi:hypothetical protein